MRKILIRFVAILLFAGSAVAQKGIDTQTTTIKNDANRTTTRPTEPPSRSFDWGKGKTEVRDRLPNPYKLNARRDAASDRLRSILGVR